MLHIVCCHFNPAGYRRPVENYRQFRDALGQPITMIEASFTGEFHCNPTIAIEADSGRNTMWQKERLLNLAMASLPKSAEKIAWIDADVLFNEPDWAITTDQMLDEFPVVQLFDSISMLGPDGETQSRHIGKVASDQGFRRRGFQGGLKPGLAWAARRDALGIDLLGDGCVSPIKRRGGLFDLDVTGGGDSSMVSGWIGRRNDWLLRHMNDSFRISFKPWAIDAWDRVRGQLGYVRGHIRHLYHGTRRNRQYGPRIRHLTRAGYNPLTDIRCDDNGLWAWASEKPEMHAGVRSYFETRHEDE